MQAPSLTSPSDHPGGIAEVTPPAMNTPGEKTARVSMTVNALCSNNRYREDIDKRLRGAIVHTWESTGRDITGHVHGQG